MNRPPATKDINGLVEGHREQSRLISAPSRHAVEKQPSPVASAVPSAPCFTSPRRSLRGAQRGPVFREHARLGSVAQTGTPTTSLGLAVSNATRLTDCAAALTASVTRALRLSPRVLDRPSSRERLLDPAARIASAPMPDFLKRKFSTRAGASLVRVSAASFAGV